MLNMSDCNSSIIRVGYYTDSSCTDDGNSTVYFNFTRDNKGCFSTTGVAADIDGNQVVLDELQMSTLPPMSATLLYCGPNKQYPVKGREIAAASNAVQFNLVECISDESDPTAYQTGYCYATPDGTSFWFEIAQLQQY